MICYDIRDPKRLVRVHRRMQSWALPIQYSVFLFCGDNRTLANRLRETRELINDKQDDLRCYPLPKSGRRQRLGRATLPAGIVHTDLPGGDVASIAQDIIV